MTFLLPLLWRLLPYALGAIALGFAYYQAQHWCNSACVAQTERADALQAEKDAAIANRNALALKWADAIQKQERVYVEVARDRADAFERIRNEARLTGLGSGGVSVRVPDNAVGLLDRAHDLANAPPAAQRIDEAAPAVSAPAVATVDACLATYIDGAEAYADAVSGWRGILQLYEALRAEQQAMAASDSHPSSVPGR